MKLYVAFKTNREFEPLNGLFFVALTNRVLFNVLKPKIHLYYELLL
jgi:hypothetical protein